MSDASITDKLKLAQRTIAMLSSMVDSGECHTTRSREMKQHGLEALADIGIANEANKQPDTEALRLQNVSARTLGIGSAASVIKAMPLDQAIQLMKSDITGLPQTQVIKGELIVAYVR